MSTLRHARTFPPRRAPPQHVLAAFRSQKIARMSFELTPDARLSISLECLNGGQ